MFLNFSIAINIKAKKLNPFQLVAVALNLFGSDRKLSFYVRYNPLDTFLGTA